MPFIIVRKDITKMGVDAIVNAANTNLQMGGGVCGAIFNAAGAMEMQAACDRLAPIKTGEAVITPGFALPAKHVIHTAGPIYRQWGAEQSERLLRSAYTESLRLAVENECESIAFPLISSGIYGYPKKEALKVATSAISEFIAEHDITVYLAVFDNEAFSISEELLGEVESYIDEHYVEEYHCHRGRELLDAERSVLSEIEPVTCKYSAPTPMETKSSIPAAVPDSLSAPGEDIEDLVENLDEPFSDTLLKLIDAKGKTDVEVYKRANLDRKLFSKIRTIKGYTPGKRTIIALAIALELNLDETKELLGRAGYALSRSRIFDVIVEYFIRKGKYDIFEINEVLFRFDQPLLGGGM